MNSSTYLEVFSENRTKIMLTTRRNIFISCRITGIVVDCVIDCDIEVKYA